VPFGQTRQQQADDEKPSQMRWDGTDKRARDLVDWGRDEALVAIVAATPPSRDAPKGLPDGEWTVRALVPVPDDLGGGVTWVDVPKGATIRNTTTGPKAWTDPVLEVVTAHGAAAAFTEE
jgi:hypothetical protein